jgi:hypothetical protein
MAYRRAHPRSAPFLALTNFSAVAQPAGAGIIARGGLYDPTHAHCSTGQLSISMGRPGLPPSGSAWLTGA